MSDPLIRACDDYVVLEPGQPERLLSAADTLTWLTGWLRKLESLPADLADRPDPAAAAQRLAWLQAMAYGTKIVSRRICC